MAQGRRDPSTLSNYQHFKTRHTAVDLLIDFPKKKLTGFVSLDIEGTNGGSEQHICLDTSFLDVQDVKVQGIDCQWTIHPREEPFGSKLDVKLASPIQNGDRVSIDIKTSTTEQCTALGWLTPEQARSKFPYMYSQCQAIHARSLFPCQDTPDSKSTYDFTITSPTTVIASGLSIGSRPGPQAGLTTYRFRQDIPIPSYLFALASGEIETANIGPRSKVATSPDFLAQAKWEFEDSTEKFIETLEKIVYPYQWSEYNLLILPSSFPYGGMENPVYTYVTPTTVSGDRQNVDVVAHELSHSYSGNLVTAATWMDFWLNEGWTTYLERRLQAALHGEPHRDFSSIIGWKALTDSVDGFGKDDEFTKLIPELTGKDPDDAFSSVPYEKGYIFLSYLEGVVGREKWNTYIPHYFTTFARKSLSSDEFKANLLAFFQTDAKASEALRAVDWQAWFYSPGLPPKPDFDTSLADVCYYLVSKWQDADFKPSKSDIDGWSANQVVVFLDAIFDLKPPLSKDRVQLLGDTYGFITSKNVEVSSRYLKVGLQSRLESVYKPTTELLGQVGRMKFVRPLYRLLNEADRKLALETFEQNKNYYHPICRDMVQKDLYGPKV